MAAYVLREQARAILFRSNAGELQRQKLTFIDAAEAFRTCGEQASGEEKLGCLKRAGECFENAGEHRRAADAYRGAEEFTDSAKQYRKAGVFDECVKVIKQNRSAMDETVAEDLLDVSKFYYLKNKEALLETEGTSDDAVYA